MSNLVFYNKDYRFWKDKEKEFFYIIFNSYSILSESLFYESSEIGENQEKICRLRLQINKRFKVQPNYLDRETTKFFESLNTQKTQICYSLSVFYPYKIAYIKILTTNCS